MSVIADHLAHRLDADRAWLERLHQRYHHRRFVHPDPLEFLYEYDDQRDRAVVGLIASSLAYGNVKAMLPAIRGVLDKLGETPAAMLRTASRTALARRFRGFRYRFTSDRQLVGLLCAIGATLNERDDLESCLVDHLDPADATILPALGGFVDALQAASPVSLAHLVPHPDRGSACKRLNLLLRWMVRRDEIDPGGWDSVDRRLLIMPLDTHVYRTARQRGWTDRKSADMRTALQITSVLRAIRPDDPLRYDFAITRPGIRHEAEVFPPPRADGNGRTGRRMLAAR